MTHNTSKILLALAVLALLLFNSATQVEAESKVIEFKFRSGGHCWCEIEQHESIDFPGWNYHARHYGIEWRKLKRVFTPLPEDVVYMRTFWLGSRFDKVFYFWGSHNSRYDVKGDRAYKDDILYGLRIAEGIKLADEDLSTVRYIELSREITEQECAAIIAKCPNLELINLEVKSAGKLIAQLVNKLPVKYVHWGFSEDKNPFNLSYNYVFLGYGKKDVEYFYLKNIENEEWFRGFYKDLVPENKLQYLELACVSDWVVAYIFSFVGRLKGLIVSSPLSVSAFSTIDQYVRGKNNNHVDNLRGLICHLNYMLENLTRTFSNRKLRYFKGRISTHNLRELSWKSITACCANKELFPFLPKEAERTLKDVGFSDEERVCSSINNNYGGVLERFTSIIRLKSSYIDNSIFNGNWPWCLRIIEGGTIRFWEVDVQWFTSSVIECIVDLFFIPYNFPPESFKPSKLVVLIIGEYEIHQPMPLGDVLRFLQPEQGYTKLYFLGNWAGLGEEPIKAKRKICKYTSGDKEAIKKLGWEVIERRLPTVLERSYALISSDFINGVETLINHPPEKE